MHFCNLASLALRLSEDRSLLEVGIAKTKSCQQISPQCDVVIQHVRRRERLDTAAVEVLRIAHQVAQPKRQCGNDVFVPPIALLEL